MRRYKVLLYAFLMMSRSVHAGERVNPDLARNLHDYMWANYLQFGGDVQQAHKWYKNILSNNSSVYVHKGYVNFLYEAGNYRHIIQLMQRMNSVFEDDSDIQLIFARSLRKEGQKKQAEELIIKLSRVCKKNVEVAFEATQIYIERKELENALHAIDDILNNSPKKPNFFVFYFLKAQIYAQLNELNNAYDNINMCLEGNPRFDKGWLLRAIIKEQEGDLPEAIKSYTSYLETADNPDKKVRQHLLELFLRVKNAHNKHVLRNGGLWRSEASYGRTIEALLNKTYRYSCAYMSYGDYFIHKYGIILGVCSGFAYDTLYDKFYNNDSEPIMGSGYDNKMGKNYSNSYGNNNNNKSVQRLINSWDWGALSL